MSLTTPHNQITVERPNGQRPRIQITFPKDEGRTKQSMRDECDINKIMAKYQKTGAIAHVNKHSADYGFATGDDFATAMLTCTKAQEMFDDLPSKIRNRFANDPEQFLNFVQDEDNKKEGQDLGLWPKDPPEPIQAVQTHQDGPTSTTEVKKTEPEPKKD